MTFLELILHFIIGKCYRVAQARGQAVLCLTNNWHTWKSAWFYSTLIIHGAWIIHGWGQVGTQKEGKDVCWLDAGHFLRIHSGGLKSYSIPKPNSAYEILRKRKRKLVYIIGLSACSACAHYKKLWFLILAACTTSFNALLPMQRKTKAMSSK